MNNGLLAIVVGMAILFLGISWSMMIVYGMMYSYGALATTLSFVESMAIAGATYGIALPTFIVGSSILKSA
jgi:hypothetical protein